MLQHKAFVKKIDGYYFKGMGRTPQICYSLYESLIRWKLRLHIKSLSMHKSLPIRKHCVRAFKKTLCHCRTSTQNYCRRPIADTTIPFRASSRSIISKWKLGSRCQSWAERQVPVRNSKWLDFCDVAESQKVLSSWRIEHRNDLPFLRL